MIDRIKGIINVEWEKIKPIQPDDVKINTNINALKKSLKNHGFSLPFAVWKDDNVIYCVDGHTRVKALKELKHEGEEVPDKLKAFEIDAKDRKEAVQILVEVFNQKNNAFDNEVLTRWLDVEQVEIENIETINLDKEVSNKKQVEEDDFEIPDEDDIKTDIKLGDLIEIGGHRLFCGDSTTIESYEKLLQGKEFDLVVTDPPYNVNYEGGTKDKLIIKNDNMDDASFFSFLSSFYGCLYEKTKPGGSWYIWHADSEGGNFRKAMNESGVKVRQCLIWNKSTFVLGRQDYQWKHEPCLYGWKDGAAHNWYSDRTQTTVLDFYKPQRNGEHPTMKPVSLISYLITNSSKDGDIVGDMFLGSGTTMVACEQLNRICYGIELDPIYCQVIVDRMQNSFPDLEVKINGQVL